MVEMVEDFMMDPMFDHLRSKSTDDSFNRTFDSSAQTQSFLLRPNHRTILDVFEGQSTLVLQGESLIDQSIFRRSQGHFNRERIPERIVHAKGFACYGQFQVTNPEISLLTKASVFAPGRITSLAVRFSTQLGERGSSDTPFGEVRGLGVKFYTDDGIYDLLMINLPVFFINDPQLFIHLNHAQKRDPRTDLYDSDNLWEFFSNRPEALNGMTFVYSDYGIPDGFRHMPAFSVNTFRLINHNGHQSYARFMLLPSAGIKNLNLSESISTRGEQMTITIF
ncbi:catalase-like protein 4 [Sarcoptes scabiei]|uniref:Catalase-like protein 4 n=1 Tax=Sarcoptes scabiei TaxID=52283 RepID=A0A132AIU0_SARSC|nr:catalase-like protein 4 [Sarcoptes scabiei]